MTVERSSLTIGQRLAIAKLVQDGLDHLVAPNMPEPDSFHYESPVRFKQFTLGQVRTDEQISVWLPLTDTRPHRNPPILRRVLESRGRDIERRRRGEVVAFPDIVATHYLMTVEQLEEFDYLVRQFEQTLSQSPNAGTGVPVEWWYGQAQEETTVQYQPNAEPLRFRGVDLSSDPIRTARFSNLERLEGLNAAFEACWDFLQTICSSPSIEGVVGHYDIDPYDVARMLLADTSDP